jgi:hypothetical protein
LPALKKNESATAGNGVAIAANVSAAIPVRAFDGMSASSVITFLRRPEWKLVAVQIQ